ncbi:MAG: helix-turn-helix domain-containing protein [Novosphingobium sp.]
MGDGEVAGAELPLESVGIRLSRAREAAGMSRTQLAGITRIPERHLAAIEAGNFAALPGRTYATGFTRSYAKALGLDQEEIVAAVRAELAAQQPEESRRPAQTFEPGDPARVPSARLAWLAAGGVVLVLIAGFLLARPMFAPGMSLPSTLQDDPPAAAPAPAAAAAPTGGPVVFSALEPRVWVKFTDGAGNQLFQKELAQGESWTVPADQPDVRIQTARPDALAITIGGEAVAKLSDSQQTIRDVPVTATALLARGSSAAGPVPPAHNPPPQPSAAAVSRNERRQWPPAPGTAAPPAPTAFPTEPAMIAPSAAPAPAPAPSAT